MIADLADQDDVRSLKQHRADDAGEVESDLAFPLDLVDAGQVILDGILGGNDLSIRPVQLVQGSEHGRALARAHGAGHEEKAVRPLDDLLDAIVVFLAESEVADADLDARSVQDTHNY